MCHHMSLQTILPAAGLTIEIITFFATTRVRNCDELPNEINEFEPANYQNILDGSLDPNYLIDLIGKLLDLNIIIQR
ncbi:unnamed protein product [Thlaspi arvense]|uniref:Uncharacterized protein n=1 Tax=Thlaspi arvense TaxID=13288 RepID=A0AAU9SPS6_THLAR|nr:unnamed protein product [Thlaspi arvense]